MPLPGNFLDLPGTQSANKEDNAVIRSGLSQCDCFVFAISASRGLDESSLLQLQDLYELFVAEGKPTFFVLTQIDKNMNRADSEEYEWEVIRDSNNEYLREYPEDFMGIGFRPIATPSYAKVNYLARNDKHETLAATEYKFGNPRRLLADLGDFYVRKVAPFKLAYNKAQFNTVCDAVEAQSRVIILTLATPVMELERRAQALEAELARFIGAKRVAIEQIRIILDNHLAYSFSTDSDIRLAQYLETEVGKLTRGEQHISPQLTRRLAQAVTNVSSEWARDSVYSPVYRWNLYDSERMAQALEVLRETTGITSLTWGDVASILDSIDSMSRVVARPTRQVVRNPNDALDTMQKTIGVTTGAIGVGGLLLTGAAALFAPLGLAGLGYVGGKILLNRAQSRNRAREAEDVLSKYWADVAVDRVAAMRVLADQRISTIIFGLERWFQEGTDSRRHDLELAQSELARSDQASKIAMERFKVLEQTVRELRT